MCGSSCSTDDMQRGFLHFKTFVSSCGSSIVFFSAICPFFIMFTVTSGSTKPKISVSTSKSESILIIYFFPDFFVATFFISATEQ